jgi:hypothetical protein
VEWFTAIAGAVQVLVLAVGGAWALYLYRTGRRGEATVGIRPDVRLYRPSEDSNRVLLVAIRVLNTSGVLFRYESAKVTLMDASARTPEGDIALLPFAEQDPFLPVYGEQVEDPDRVLEGELFEMPSQVVLEPGESVDSEVAFLLDAAVGGLLAVRILVQGYQRGETKHPWAWSSFFFVDLTKLADPVGVGTISEEER